MAPWLLHGVYIEKICKEKRDIKCNQVLLKWSSSLPNIGGHDIVIWVPEVILIEENNYGQQCGGECQQPSKRKELLWVKKHAVIWCHFRHDSCIIMQLCKCYITKRRRSILVAWNNSKKSIQDGRNLAWSLADTPETLCRVYSTNDNKRAVL